MGNSQEKNCVHCKESFIVDEDDLKFYKRISVPAPTLCPDCRRQRRFAFRNERNLYKIKSSLSGEEILSCYHPFELKALRNPESGQLSIVHRS